MLLARQGTKALTDLRERARSRRSAGRELGDAGLVAAGGLLMVLPGLPRRPGRAALPAARSPAGSCARLLTRLVLTRLPDRLRGPVRVESVRTAGVGGATRYDPAAPLVIEGEIVRGPDGRPLT